MALFDKLNESSLNTKPGVLCTVSKIRQNLDAYDMKALDEAIEKIRVSRKSRPSSAAGGYNCSWLHRALVADGHQVSLLTLQKHVSKKCACGI